MALRSRATFGNGFNDESIRGPAVADRLRDLIQRVVDVVYWKVTVDLFASAANHRTDRFVSWWPEPDAEAYNAFTLPSWRQSRCPVCSGEHQEAVYAFPPPKPRQLREVVAKAVADRAVGIFWAPVVVTSPVWQKSRQASVLRNEDGFGRVRRNPRALSGAFLHTDLTIFACDFGRLLGDADGRRDPGCARGLPPSTSPAVRIGSRRE